MKRRPRSNREMRFKLKIRYHPNPESGSQTSNSRGQKQQGLERIWDKWDPGKFHRWEHNSFGKRLGNDIGSGPTIYPEIQQLPREAIHPEDWACLFIRRHVQPCSWLCCLQQPWLETTQVPQQWKEEMNCSICVHDARPGSLVMDSDTHMSVSNTNTTWTRSRGR